MACSFVRASRPWIALLVEVAIPPARSMVELAPIDNELDYLQPRQSLLIRERPNLARMSQSVSLISIKLYTSIWLYQRNPPRGPLRLMQAVVSSMQSS